MAARCRLQLSVLRPVLSTSLAAQPVPAVDWQGEVGRGRLLNSVGESQQKEVERGKCYKGKRDYVTHLAPGRKKIASSTMALRTDSLVRWHVYQVQ